VTQVVITIGVHIVNTKSIVMVIASQILVQNAMMTMMTMTTALIVRVVTPKAM
jgi:hypothetical protein